MKTIATKIDDVFIIEPPVFSDERGFFLETFQKRKYYALGITMPFVQDNYSGSVQGTLRGLHYQIKNPQGKLVFVLRGEIFDVAVDIRKDSPTFGEHVGATLSERNRRQIWIPPGFAHGYYVLSAGAEIIYKATDYYSPEWEGTLLWNDPDLNIDWPIIKDLGITISAKDSDGCFIKDAEVY